MHEYFVYLIKSQKRLVITNHSVSSDDYVLMMNNNGYDRYLQENMCKLFCIGYIRGSALGVSVINSVDEFR